MSVEPFSNSDLVVDGVVHVWSDDAYDALDSVPGPVEWQTWVMD